MSVVHEHVSCSGLKVRHSWRLLVFVPMDQSGSGLKGATNKPCSHNKASEGGVVSGGGKSTDVHLSFCLLLLSPFPVFNLLNTCCSYSMLSGHPPTPPMLLLAQPLKLPISLPIGPGSCCTTQPHCAPATITATHIIPPLCLWSGRNNRRGYRVRAVVIPMLTHTHAPIYSTYCIHAHRPTSTQCSSFYILEV